MDQEHGEEIVSGATGPAGTIEQLLSAGCYRIQASSDRLEGEAEVQLDDEVPFARVVVTAR